MAAGVITLGFLALHLQQLRWRPSDGLELEVLQQVLLQPISLVVYAAGSLAIGLHLLHGAEAAHRNLGWLTPANGQHPLGGRLLASGIGGGFLLISLGLALGLGMTNGLPDPRIPAGLADAWRRTREGLPLISPLRKGRWTCS